MASHIEEIRKLNDPQKAYKWRVFLPSLNLPNIKTRENRFQGQLPGINGTPFNNSINSQVEALPGGAKFPTLGNLNLGFNPSLQVEEVIGVPFSNIEREGFYEAGSNIYFPALEDLDTFSVTFYQDESTNIPNYIQAWKRKIINQDGTKNLPGDYKFPITIQLLNGQNQVTNEIQLKDCFPTTTTGYNLTNQSENLKLTQEFSVDRVIYTNLV